MGVIDASVSHSAAEGPPAACSNWASACGLARSSSLTLPSGPVCDERVATCMQSPGDTLYSVSFNFTL
eukprot:3862982-Prymnesium_polylepis.1